MTARSLFSTNRQRPSLASEIDNLLEIVHKIKARGMGIIYISHHLDEVFKIADKITVLRDGQYIKTIGVGETDEPHLIRDMVGRDASAFYSREFYPKGRDGPRGQQPHGQRRKERCRSS